MMNKRRVVITGLGCVTALAESADELFAALLEGKSGISLLENFDVSTFPVRIGGEIKNFDVTKYVEHRVGKRMDPFSQYAIGAAIQAMEDSKLSLDKEDLYRVGVIVGVEVLVEVFVGVGVRVGIWVAVGVHVGVIVGVGVRVGIIVGV